MIWTEELSASLDQSGGVVVFHRVEVSRAQQLALVIADKIGSMVEQNEKTLDIKMGGSGNWGDRGDGAKGEKRGEQTQERRNRQGERRGGARGKLYIFFLLFVLLTGSPRIHAWAGWALCSRAWKPDADFVGASFCLHTQIIMYAWILTCEHIFPAFSIPFVHVRVVCSFRAEIRSSY